MYKITFSDLSELNIPLATNLVFIPDSGCVKALTSFWRGAKNLIPEGVNKISFNSIYGDWNVSKKVTDKGKSPERYQSKALFFASAGELSFEAVISSVKQEVNWLRKVSRLPILTSNMNKVLKDCEFKREGKRTTLVDKDGKLCVTGDVCNEDYFMLMQTSLIHKTGKDLNVIFLDTTGFEDLETLVKSICILTEKTIMGCAIVFHVYGDNASKVYEDVLKLKESSVVVGASRLSKPRATV